MDIPLISNMMELASGGKELKNRILVLSSEDKVLSSDTTNQFTLHVRPAVLRARAVSLLWAIIPNSTYNINQYNNTLYFTDGGGAHTITITPASYNTTTLGAAITAAMTSAGSQAYTVAYDASTYHYTISAAGAFSLQYINTNTATIFPTLGYKFGVNSGSATSFVSNAAVALWDQPYYLIRVDKFTSHVQTSDPDSNFGAFIVDTVAAENGELIRWTVGNAYEQKTLVNTNIDQLYIQLYDHEGRLADINDSEWQFCISVEYE